MSDLVVNPEDRFSCVAARIILMRLVQSALFCTKPLDFVNILIKPGPEVIKLFSCSAQLRLKFILLINVKMPTIVGILTFISRINY